MRLRFLVLVASLAAGAAAPALAAPKVEVVRFHTPETLARLGSGPLEVVPAPGIDGASLETRAWLDAVARVLATHGLAPLAAGGAARVAEVRLTRDVVPGSRARSPVSIGIGGSVGSGGGFYRHRGSSVGLGLGLGLGLGGGPRELVDSELAVTIRERASGAPLWEGRARLRAPAKSRDASPAQTAGRLAEALFAGFPGRPGETIEAR